MPVKIIFGPPGTGKTETLLKIVERELARGVPPSKIAFISFTKRAANEAITRACDKFGLSPDDLPWFRTLHSLCFRQLGLSPEGVLADGPARRAFEEWAGLQFSSRALQNDDDLSNYLTDDRVLHMINLARVRGISLRDQYDWNDDNLPWNHVATVADRLQKYKQALSLVDYTDMLENFVAQSPSMGFDTVIQDESQDASWLMWKAFATIMKGARQVAIAGDDDQAIFEWAGAAARYLLAAKGEREVLGQSFRVPQAIQSLALSIINDINDRQPKEWKPRPVEGAIDRFMSVEEPSYDGKSILVLARNNFLIQSQVVPHLRRLGMVYEYQGESSVDIQLLSVIEDWERLRAGGAVLAGAAGAIYAYLPIGVGVRRSHKTLPAFPNPDEAVTLADLKARGGLLTEAIWHEALTKIPANTISYMLAARRSGERLRAPPRIRLSTIHGAKGAQADHVVLMTAMARRSAREAEVNRDAERRVFYVGVTRARERLSIIEPRQGLYYPI